MRSIAATDAGTEAGFHPGLVPERGLVPESLQAHGSRVASPVLLIDDDTELAAMLEEYLRAAGLEVTTRHDLAAGLAELRRDPGAHELLLLDVMLPDGDGLEFCRRIRSGEAGDGVRTLPIVMLTARGDETDRILGLELGADDYLPKPFNPRELLARIRAVLRRGPHEGGSERLRFGRLEIDLGERRVRIDGRSCELTAHQFELLRLLAERPGRVLSRDALMQRLRGHEAMAFDRSIDVHVSRIRAAIEDDPRKPRRILTVRGAGYVFAARQDEPEP